MNGAKPPGGRPTPRFEILSPIQTHATALDVSAMGIQVALDQWLSTGALCDLRITTHTGRVIFKRARVIWARRVGEECVAGLHVVGSIVPPPDAAVARAPSFAGLFRLW